jgi:hypothetical protein
MPTPVRLLAALLAFTDLAFGAVAVVWPGVLEELLHPFAMATTFRLHQWIGAAALARGIFGLWTAVRGRRSEALAALWAVPVPGDALLAWSAADTGPYSTAFYAGQAIVGASWAVLLAVTGRSPGRGTPVAITPGDRKDLE